MKKLFLLLTSAFMGVAAFAGNTWELDEANMQIVVANNEYGEPKVDGVSTQWQAGNPDILPDVVSEATGNTAWTPAIGETFVITMKGVANFTGNVQACMIDERAEADYWGNLSGYPSFDVTAGEEFSQNLVLQISATSMVNQKGEEIELTVPGIVFQIKGMEAGTFPKNADGSDMNADDDCIFTLSVFEITYSPAIDIESPIALTFQKESTNPEDGYDYQYQGSAVGVTAAKAGQFVNIELEGVAYQNIKTLMYALVDNAEDVSYWFPLAEMTTIATDIEKGQKVSIKKSIELTATSTSEASVFIDVLMGMDPVQATNLYFSNATIKTWVSETPKYSTVAVEEVSAVAIENGVVYSAGQIVVYNAAGQVVATASQEFAIASLEAGVYFVATAEGTAKIVK